MIEGYAIAALCVMLFILVSIITHSLKRPTQDALDPKHKEMAELMVSGQVFHGQIELTEGQATAIYTVKLRHDRHAFVYQTFKNGTLVETLREKKFDPLIEAIEHRGILSIEELDLAL